ncbi:MAG TPA: MMPL family transporter [Myxococcaceae bacterium]|nr:MMPL family transporter [Myxococcaceae bacterium]
MFIALARAVSRHRLVVLAVTLVVLVLAVLSLIRGGSLTSGTIEGTESAQAAALVRGAAGADTDTSIVALFTHGSMPATDPIFQGALGLQLEKVSARPEVESVVSVATAPEQGRARFVSPDGKTALVLVRLKGDEKVAVHAFPAVRAALRDGPFLVEVTGKPAFLTDLNAELEHDLLRAELVSFPLALLVLIWVFRTLVAALLPIVVGGLAVLAGVAAVLALSRHLDMAQYTLNVVSLIGLGVAIDYSLFMVSRFRDELLAGGPVETALERTVDTAGRAVAFSGLAVAAGLSGLLFYKGSYLAAMGLGGAIVVGFAVLFALTALPALLGWLGPRVNLGRVPLPAFGLRPGVWNRLASWVMQHPLAVLLPTLGFIALVGWPFVRLQTAGTDITALPESAESRQGAAAVARAFPEQSATRILVAVKFPGPPFTPERAGALYDVTRRWAKLPGVVGVESIVNLDPTVTREQYLQLAGAGPAFRPPEFALAEAVYLNRDVAVAQVLTSAPASSEDARRLVLALRQDRTVGDGRALVGGQSAGDVDSTAFVLGRAPRAVGFVVLVTLVTLFFLLGSVVLPLKAVLVNFLSLAGSFGALVWIFQEGHLRWLLHFQPGPLEPALPLLLFCTLFGLSMDYEVLMLSRMREEWARTHDNRHSVAEGLEQTGGLITSAAAIMVAVFAAFALAKILVVKAMGVGMAIAVTLDATLIRVLIVPATMRLFGAANWWAPRALQRFTLPAHGEKSTR